MSSNADSPEPAAPVATLRIAPAGLSVPIPEGFSLLDAARLAGIALASSCRNGTCRACMARVLSGSVHHRIAWPGLSSDEKAEGWVLPCVALADGDVELLQPDWQPRPPPGTAR